MTPRADALASLVGQAATLIARDWTVPEIAAELGVTPRYVRRLLARSGTPPGRAGRPMTRAPVRTYRAEHDGVRVTVRAEGRETIRDLEDRAGGCEAVGAWAIGRIA